MLCSAAFQAETEGQTTYSKGNNLRKFKFKGKSGQTTYLKGNNLRKFKFKGKSVNLKGNGPS
jgi:hypothetical protein